MAETYGLRRFVPQAYRSAVRIRSPARGDVSSDHVSSATPAESPATPARSASGPLDRLPPIMLEDAAQRTAWLCLSIAILAPVTQVSQRWMQPELYAAMMHDTNR